jgi:hypothetical protein
LARKFELQYPDWTPAQVLDACSQSNQSNQHGGLQQATSLFSQPYNRTQQLRREQATLSSQPAYNEDDVPYIMEDFNHGEHIASTSSMQNRGGAFGFSILSAAADSLPGRDNENSRMTSGSRLDTKMFPVSSFTVKLPPKRHSETEMTIDYPLALQEKIVTLRSKLYPLLEKLGVGGAGFSFGYDILPETFILEDHDDHSIFTGSFRLVLC